MKNTNVSWVLNFRVHILQKGVVNYSLSNYRKCKMYYGWSNKGHRLDFHRELGFFQCLGGHGFIPVWDSDFSLFMLCDMMTIKSFSFHYHTQNLFLSSINFFVGRKYVPVLKKYPPKYIYEPWTAPLSMQRTAGCVIGEDYPRPIVDHQMAVKTNLARMKKARAGHYGGGADEGD